MIRGFLLIWWEEVRNYPHWGGNMGQISLNTEIWWEAEQEVVRASSDCCGDGVGLTTFLAPRWWAWPLWPGAGAGWLCSSLGPPLAWHLCGRRAFPPAFLQPLPLTRPAPAERAVGTRYPRQCGLHPPGVGPWLWPQSWPGVCCVQSSALWGWRGSGG